MTENQKRPSHYFSVEQVLDAYDEHCREQGTEHLARRARSWAASAGRVDSTTLAELDLVTLAGEPGEPTYVPNEAPPREEAPRFVSPAAPATDHERELVTVAVEECVEVAEACVELAQAALQALRAAQRGTKLLRFGPLEVQPGQALTNAERLGRELGDLREVTERLQRSGAVPAGSVEAGQENKRRQLDKYLQTTPPPSPAAALAEAYGGSGGEHPLWPRRLYPGPGRPSHRGTGEAGYWKWVLDRLPEPPSRAQRASNAHGGPGGEHPDHRRRQYLTESDAGTTYWDWVASRLEADARSAGEEPKAEFQPGDLKTGTWPAASPTPLDFISTARSPGGDRAADLRRFLEEVTFSPEAQAHIRSLHTTLSPAQLTNEELVQVIAAGEAIPRFRARDWHTIPGRGTVAVVDLAAPDQAPRPRAGMLVEVDGHRYHLRGVERGGNLSLVGLLVVPAPAEQAEPTEGEGPCTTN